MPAITPVSANNTQVNSIVVSEASYRIVVEIQQH